MVPLLKKKTKQSTFLYTQAFPRAYSTSSQLGSWSCTNLTPLITSSHGHQLMTQPFLHPGAFVSGQSSEPFLWLLHQCEWYCTIMLQYICSSYFLTSKSSTAFLYLALPAAKQLRTTESVMDIEDLVLAGSRQRYLLFSPAMKIMKASCCE